MATIAAIATTAAGLRRLIPVVQGLPAELWVTDSLDTQTAPPGLSIHTYADGLRPWLQQAWHRYDGFIFCLATGAVVRLIAPLLENKATDPAVVVIDEAGQYAISLCSGHQGGADRLAHQVSQHLGSAPVVTGAAHELGLSGIDVLGNPFGWQRGSGQWTAVAAVVASQEPVEVIQDCGSDLWQQHLPPQHPFQFGFPELKEKRQAPQARIWISPVQRRFNEESKLPKVQWHPRVLHVGIGCERGVSQALIQLAIDQVCQQYHLATAAIATLGSATIKADEAGLVALAQEKGWPLQCFSPEQLAAVEVPNPSQTVAAAVGTPSVAEAAASLAVACQDGQAESGSRQVLRVPKQIVRHPDHTGAVTVAIAQAEREYIGRRGELLLVGTGPGSLDQMTAAAKAALSRADAVIGYQLYIDLLRPLLRPGQIVEALPITQERQRAERAVELATWGLTVAVVSSGDCGIYGMGGLVLETLKQSGWDGQAPAVSVFPGISALQSAASRVGAPLMHDFCAISLSDLLTPWEVIQKRLRAAAAGDFIVALYNPKSKTRTEQIVTARQILLEHRRASTPVALARALYRPEETVILTTLGDMLEHPIDMLTTVLIGNRSSLSHAGWFITPRGYLGFQQT